MLRTIFISLFAVLCLSLPASADNVGKTLVVFFSGTGNTRRVAGYIAEELGADVFELLPDPPYSREDLDYRNKNSRVMREHDNKALQKITLRSVSVGNWNGYDTVFIGYPIWGGNAAWPVNGFIAANDFTGKTVIPFCTHGGSGIGQSGELLAKTAGTGNWRHGRGFRSGASRGEVISWLKGLVPEQTINRRFS